MKLAPICLFTYNRPDETKQTIKSLKENNLSHESDLIIFSDGPKNDSAKIKVHEVRDFLKTVDGFKTIRIFESKDNKGLANSIINGVSQVIKIYGNVIVLEDDLITSPNFLDFMNQALDFYQTNDKIFSISGYTMDLPSLKIQNQDYYLGYRASSWGWATWNNRWKDIDWSVNDYSSFKWNLFQQFRFMRGGSDMPYMLWKQMNGRIDSWAIRWCYFQFRNDLLTIFPTKSKIKSIGFGESATHTKKTKRFHISIDNENQVSFQFTDNININAHLVNEFKVNFSFFNRLNDRF